MLIYSDRAQFDLEDIWLFSALAWDPPQADDYVAAVVEVLERAAASPSRLRRSTATGYQVVTCRSHRAYVRIVDEGLFVTRILHMSMDERRHLP